MIDKSFKPQHSLPKKKIDFCSKGNFKVYINYKSRYRIYSGVNINCSKFVWRLKYIHWVKDELSFSLAYRLVKWKDPILHLVDIFQPSHEFRTVTFCILIFSSSLWMADAGLCYTSTSFQYTTNFLSLQYSAPQAHLVITKKKPVAVQKQGHHDITSSIIYLGLKYLKSLNISKSFTQILMSYRNVA